MKKVVLNKADEFTQVSVSQINLEEHHYFYVYKGVWEVPQSKGLIFENIKLGKYDDGELYQITSIADYEELKKKYPLPDNKTN